VFSWLYHFIKGPNPLHPALVGRLSPMTFRRFASTDLPQCLELYAANEPGRFPGGVVNLYEKTLLGQNSYFLVAESEGRIIASGGISYYLRDDLAVLCFGLVHPSHQGRGIGTALLLARLAMLKPHSYDYRVLIFAVEKSIAYYRRFGFKVFPPWADGQGKLHPSGQLIFTPAEILQCRQLLKERGVIVPDDEALVPFRKEANAD
jgi:ribosomal protein S18 acetylase RimI-like enzyme